MMYRRSMLSLMLTPFLLFSVADDIKTSLRIKQLEYARCTKEKEMAKLNKKIFKETQPYFECIDIAREYWIHSGEGDEKIAFSKFINELVEKVIVGEDIASIIDGSPQVKKHEYAVFMISRVVFQGIFLDSLVVHYEHLATELRAINKELNSLRS